MTHARDESFRHLFHEACAFAARKHRHQIRKDGKTPYISHLFRVALTVRHVFGCEDELTLAAALLHDTIEDTQTDFEDLADRFGPEVARLVAALTNNMALPEPARERDYDARLAASDWRARLIKLADTYDNMLDFHSALHPPGKHNEYLERLRRAIELARPDAADARAHPAVARAIDLCSRLLDAEPA
ncbi:MAG: HD domain-containing protein [Planctomycetota bacterium]|nr:HD domain-containing protein [Planctomycetota bacterium]